MDNKNNNRINHLGAESKTHEGCDIKIVEYRNYEDVDILVDNKYVIKNTSYDNFIRGAIKNPYHRSICGVGYIGVGNYLVSLNRIHTKQYLVWRSLLGRCYNENNLIKNPTYIGCSTCEEWHNFQNFAKWFDENYYEVDDEKMCLDKDILVKGNKIYSPTTCIFVPNTINMLFIRYRKNNLPIGVKKSWNKFIARINYKHKEYILGSYNTVEEAFSSYKIAKESRIKQVADEYKDKIPQKLYDSMCKYKIEITDSYM